MSNTPAKPSKPTVKLVAVMSLDGKITKDTEIHTREWISAEDKQLFADLVAQSDVVISGMKTYRNMLPAMNKQKPFIIYTRSPDQYQPTDNVTFTNTDPKSLIDRLHAEGHEHILVSGGREIYSLFLQSHLVDEILLTIEPVIHGSGKSFLAEHALDQPLQLTSIQQLNERGTLLLYYRVVTNSRIS
jgi:dihydrofolate reductase